MNRNLLSGFFAIIVLSFSTLNCTKEKQVASCPGESAFPECIQKKINQYLQLPKSDPPAEVWQYTYHGSTVYFFPNQWQIVVDGCSELYDNHCNYLCSPTGCFTGNGDGRCPEFFTERTNEILLWRDNR